MQVVELAFSTSLGRLVQQHSSSAVLSVTHGLLYNGLFGDSKPENVLRCGWRAELKIARLAAQAAEAFSFQPRIFMGTSVPRFAYQTTDSAPHQTFLLRHVRAPDRLHTTFWSSRR